jgi:hypothetical protein
VHEEQAMKAITKLLAGGVAIAALASAAPAAAQYYPGYGYGGGDIIGSIINSVAGGGMGYGSPYGSPYGYGQPGYGANSQVAVNQCANAVQMRLSGAYGGGYGGYGGYGYNSYGAPGAGRVLGISRVEPRQSGGLTVRGVATSGRYGGYGQGQGQVDLVWKCRTDYRGMIVDVDVDPAQSNYGYGYNGYNGYNGGYNGYNQPYSPYDYSQYGYRRY